MGDLGMLASRYVNDRRVRADILPTTARNLSYHLAGFVESFGARPVGQLGRRSVEQWQATIGHLSPATRRSRLSSVRGFCRWLVQSGYIRKDPTLGIPSIRQPKPVPRALPAASVSKLLASVPDPRAKVIIWLMVGMGLRCLEVSSLELSDYDPTTGILVVTGKYSNQRALPVPAEPKRALDEYLALTGHVSGPLIRSYRRPRAGIKPDTISGMVSRWMNEAGVKVRRRDGVSAHALRHTAASDVLDKAHDLRVVQQMLGHARLATTAIYLRRADSAKLREAMEGRPYDAPVAEPVELPPLSLF